MYICERDHRKRTLFTHPPPTTRTLPGLPDCVPSGDDDRHPQRRDGGAFVNSNAGGLEFKIKEGLRGMYEEMIKPDARKNVQMHIIACIY